MIDLMRYLPKYYQKSIVMRTIQEAIAPEIPDGTGDLWRVFFLSTCPEEYLNLWQKELEAVSREDLFAKLRATSLFNRELAESMGLDLLETYRLSPEAGYTLSGNDAMFPDGIHYGPLITDVIVKPPDIAVTRHLIEITKAAGFRYWLSVKISEFISHEAGIITGGLNLYPGIILPSMDDVLSGPKVLRNIVLSIIRQNRLTVAESRTEAALVVAYDGLLLKFTELGALEILQNVDDLSVEELDVDEESDASELFSHMFETGPFSIPAINKIWNGFSFKAIVPQSVTIEQNQVGITVAAPSIRSEWSQVVSFLEPGISFLENNVKAQYSKITVEVG